MTDYFENGVFQRTKFIKDWISALRSGNYKQATGALYDGNGYCCLGVACDLIQMRRAHTPFDDYKFYFNDYSSAAILPSSFAELLQISNNGEFTLYDLNENVIDNEALTPLNDDHGFTFEQIADVIQYVEDNGLWTQRV